MDNDDLDQQRKLPGKILIAGDLLYFSITHYPYESAELPDVYAAAIGTYASYKDFDNLPDAVQYFNEGLWKAQHNMEKGLTEIRNLRDKLPELVKGKKNKDDGDE